jgi:hypothetical protein
VHYTIAATGLHYYVEMLQTKDVVRKCGDDVHAQSSSPLSAP